MVFNGTVILTIVLYMGYKKGSLAVKGFDR